MNKEKWKAFEEKVNSEYMVQVDDSGFDAALLGVELAMSVIQEQYLLVGKSEAFNKAVDFIFTFGKWRTLSLPPQIKYELYVRNYGEEEVEAMREAGEVSFDK